MLCSGSPQACPDGGGIVKDGAHDSLKCGHQLFGREDFIKLEGVKFG